MNEKEDIPMIPQHQAESMMADMRWGMRCVTIVAVSFAIAMVAAIVIFVNGYTSRTKDWLNTLAELQRQPAVTEVTDGIQQQPSP